MNERVTIVVVPRDRFSSVVGCAESILQNTPEPFRLVFLDFGYSARTLKSLREVCKAVPMEIVPVGRTIPMAAFREYLPRIETPYVAWVDNDTYVMPGWLSAMLDRADQGARVVLPITLEMEGLDIDPRGLKARNHISHSELRKVTVEGVEYVFDHKPYRRAALADLPSEPHTVDFFELHTFFAETEVLRKLDLPDMVVREHIDLGIQLHRLGIPIWCEPRAVVQFANIHEPPTLEDIGFFNFRWAQKRIDRSHALFEERWGYRFYNEKFLKNWATRRKVFSVARFLRIPQKQADFVSRAFNKFFAPPLPSKLRKDPLAESTRVLEPLATGALAV